MASTTGELWGGSAVSSIWIHGVVSFYTKFSHFWVESLRCPRPLESLVTYAHTFHMCDFTTSCSVALVCIVGRLCGHSDCDCNDAAGTGPSYHISCFFDHLPPYFQLRHATEGFCRFVLIRVVRLTIETNALTGTHPSLGKLLDERESNFLLS